MTRSRVLATCLGYPRIGVRRELKQALEAFWAGRQSAEQLAETGASLRRRHWLAMQAAGLDHIPSNDFSLYDQVLDTAVLLGVVPRRYRDLPDGLGRYFAMARGAQDPSSGVDVPALEMTKWFDTNYHYIVPELEPDQSFGLDPSELLAGLDEARRSGIEPRPVLLGPVTFLALSKLGAGATGTPLDHVERLLPAYERLLGLLCARGVEWLQLDEPCLVLELDGALERAYRTALARLVSASARPRLLLTTYFGTILHNLRLLEGLALDALHVDACRAPEQLEPVIGALGPETILSIGAIDGRNVWRADLDAAHARVRRAVNALGAERVWVAPSCSLLHVPVDLDAEGGATGLDPELKSWLAFAAQKLVELRALADSAEHDLPQGPELESCRRALAVRRSSPRTRNDSLRRRLAAASSAPEWRRAPYAERLRAQRERLGLPLLPTTTIGSFPQTKEVRSARAARRGGRISDEAYRRLIEAETARCIGKQEELGLDVLVHGELERSDMVEYFGQLLDGYAFTDNGWVQSYGSRCVKPPLLYGDVARSRPMTVDWARYAQSLTSRPVKGMLTGPATMLEWSFVRDDQPRAETCLQIALALRDEVLDLESAGIAVIQVDEPALREGLPLCRSRWPEYLGWAVRAFRLATGGVRDQTQIHTHMCYSEFGDILDAIAALDADVLSIEASRSRMELLSDFERFEYPGQIGPGIWDIHSPRVPDTRELLGLIEQAAAVLPVSRLWVNPDCGLKTRDWPEVEASLANMVQAARLARQRLSSTHPLPAAPHRNQ